MLQKLFNVPDFIIGRIAYETFFQLKKEHPYAFYEDSNIISIFGCPPNCIWNGGGHFNDSSFFNGPHFKDLVEFYNHDLNVPIRLTFTNPVLTRKHYDDTYGNLITEIAHNGKNEIVVSDNEFENYLRQYYPNFKYVKSIIGTENEPVFLDDKYYLSVMRRSMNNNWEYLETIDPKLRGKIEFLCTDPCPDNCPRIYSHYKGHGRTQLNYGIPDKNSRCSMMDVKGLFINHYASTLQTFINRERIENEYIPRGFNVFKLSGRFSIGAIITNLAEYLTKPDYREDICEILMNTYTEGYHSLWY